jgi:hypothetical protein
MDELSNLGGGLGAVGIAYYKEKEAYQNGLRRGVIAGKGSGVLMALECSRKRFGSRLMRLLSEQVEKDHREELLDG